MILYALVIYTSAHVRKCKMSGSKRVPKVTEEECADANVPVHMRDYCAHLFIPLMKCRRDNYYLPWKCRHEKNAWEHCEHEDYMDRIRKKRAQMAAQSK